MSLPKKNLRRKSIQYSDPGKILDLVLDLTDYCCANLQVKLNNYLKEESESELVLQVTVNAEHVEASIETVGGVVLTRKKKLSEPQKFVDLLKSNVEQSDLLANFPPDFQQIVHLHLPKEQPKKRVVMIPIVDKPFSVIVCVISAKILDEHVTALVQECFLFCWPTLSKCIALEYECKLKEKCQQLLRVARRLFTQVASLKTLLHIAMEQAKLLTKAEHCSVMLVDQERMEFVEAISEQESDNVPTERRLPLYKGIAGLALKTGCLVNAKNPKEHPNYDPEIDCCQNVDCKNILCFPIRDQTGIIGVGMLINKVYDPYFDAMDEEMALAFSIYCGVCIVHSVVYQKIQEAHIRNSIANELVMYHMKVHDTEVARVAECTGFHNHPHLSSLHFNLRALPLRELPCYVIKMFTHLGFERQFNIKREKFIRFVLHVKKGYRDVPYHNWLHGFSVTQWAYSALINFRIVSKGYFTELQALMYFISALVHDLDHRGTTNSFHIQGQTTLAALYSSEGSVMERHHLAQAMCILNTEGCDILESLPRRDYDRALMLLRDFILASDLANFFKNLNEYKIISADYQKGNRAHAAALQALLMNAADLSDQLKDWNYIKKTAAAVLSEFFKQGDVEKLRGELPAVTMDREKCFIPELQIHFLTSICVPLFELLGTIIHKAAPCVKIIENHIERWEAAKPVFAEVPHTAGLSILLSPELDTLIEQNIKEKERLRTEGERDDADEDTNK